MYGLVCGPTLLPGVQLNFTPEMEVFYMLFERCLSIFSMASLKQHIEYLHIRCKIQLDLPVQSIANVWHDRLLEMFRYPPQAIGTFAATFDPIIYCSALYLVLFIFPTVSRKLDCIPGPCFALRRRNISRAGSVSSSLGAISGGDAEEEIDSRGKQKTLRSLLAGWLNGLLLCWERKFCTLPLNGLRLVNSSVASNKTITGFSGLGRAWPLVKITDLATHRFA